MKDPLEDKAITASEVSGSSMVGRLIDKRFRVESELGQGATSRVYKAVDLKLDRIVAVKVLHTLEGSSDVAVERFKRELLVGGKLEHPGIVKVLSVGTVDDCPYLVMEYVDGSTLAGRMAELKTSGVLFKKIFVQLLEALKHAHEFGIVHRDIKPSNILVTQTGTNVSVKLADFGIARLTESSDQKVTQTGTVIGSASYMSPEQARSSPVDNRSDLYSLACVMYEGLTGEAPFTGDSPFEVMYKHLNEPFPSLVSKGLAPDVCRFMQQASEKDPARRFQTAEQMQSALNALPSGAITSVRHIMDWSIPVLLLSIAFYAGVVAMSAYYSLRRDSQPRSEIEIPPETVFVPKDINSLKTMLDQEWLPRKSRGVSSEARRKVDKETLIRLWIEKHTGGRNSPGMRVARRLLSTELKVKQKFKESLEQLQAIDTQGMSQAELLEYYAAVAEALRCLSRFPEAVQVGLKGRTLSKSDTFDINESSAFAAALVLEQLAQAAESTLNWKLARDAAQEAIDFMGKYGEKRYDYHLETFRVLAASEYHLGNSAVAEKLYKRRVEIALQAEYYSIKDRVYMIVPTLRDLQWFYQDSGKYSAAHDVYSEIEKYSRTIPVDDTALQNELWASKVEAHVLATEKRFSEAQKMLDRVMISTGSISVPQLRIGLYRDCALIYSLCGNIKASVLASEAARKIYDQTDLMSSGICLAEAAGRSRKSGDLKSFNLAVENASRAWEANPKALDAYFFAGDTLITGYHDPWAAREVLLKALQMSRKKRMGAVDLASIYVRLGSTALQLKEFEDAIRDSRKARDLIGIKEGTRGSLDPAAGNVALASANVILQVLRAEDKQDQARVAFEEMKVTLPVAPSLSRGHFFVQGKEIYSSLGENEKALDCADEALAIYSAIKADEGLAQAGFCRAETLFDLGRVTEAQEQFKETAKTQESLKQLGGASRSWLRLLICSEKIKDSKTAELAYRNGLKAAELDGNKEMIGRFKRRAP